MAKQRLVIASTDQGHFFLSVLGGTLTIGGNPAEAEIVLRDLHISRIHCEVEVDEGFVVVCNPKTESGATGDELTLRQELHPGQALQIGHAHLRFESDGTESASSAHTHSEDDIPGLAEEASPEESALPEDSASSPPVSHGRASKRFLVTDGADQGQTFTLPQAGTIFVGKNKKHASVALNDFYVSRVHCELQISGDSILVTHVSGPSGTLINGMQITKQQLFLGDVLRVGNSHLRLEAVVPGETGKRDAGGAMIPVASEDGNRDRVEDHGAFSVLDDMGQGHAGEAAKAPTAGAGESTCLPHSPVDQLLKLEDTVLGHYKIGPLLGRGQSSLVFRAQDQRNNLIVVLKVLSPDFPKNDEELQRFIRAMKVAPQLQHRHLVTLLGVGKTGPYCWIAREYVEGESLARLIMRLKEGGKLDWARACRVAVHLGKVLDYLQQKKVAHGNITPRNILIQASDHTTKLTDLMLGQGLEGSFLQKAILANKMLLDLPFTPPELTGASASATPLGDLYSLGTIIYALLTGQAPFIGDSPNDVLALVRNGNVVKPTKLQKGIPITLEAAVLKMMARRPEERFQTATDMLAVVEPIANEHGIKV